MGDLQGKIGTGALTAFADRLTGYNPVTGVAAAEAGGSDLYLTIDLDCQLAAWNALNGRKGAVLLYDYETGRSSVWCPPPPMTRKTSRTDLESDPDYEGAYINRALRAAFTPGSILKTVTLHAAIESCPTCLTAPGPAPGPSRLATRR